MNNTLSNSLKSLILLAFAVAARYIQISFMIGSKIAFFSGINIATPLFGSLGGTFGLILLIFFKISSYSFKSIYILSFLAHVIPGIASAAYWVKRSKFFNVCISVFLPLICMIAFVAHPVGNQACIYSFYWLIPIAIFLSKTNNLFLHALASTFIAHAVGSVIWLYTIPMTVEMWHALIPIVVIERLLFASGIVIMHSIGQYIFGKIDNYKKSSIAAHTPNCLKI